MSMIASIPPARFPVLPIHRLTVGQYHRMIDSGVLSEEDSVELLEGLIVDKMPQNPPHPAAITRIQRRLDRVLGEQWIIRVQSPITTRDSEPEPDIAVAEGPEERYWKRHPQPEDIGLVVEASDSTLEADRLIMGRIYARARLPVYWMANLVARTIEVYTEPKGGKEPGYRKREDFGMEDVVPLILRGKEIARIPVNELLPA